MSTPATSLAPAMRSLNILIAEHRAAYDALTAALDALETARAALHKDLPLSPSVVVGTTTVGERRECLFATTVEEIEAIVHRREAADAAVFGAMRAAQLAAEKRAKWIGEFESQYAAIAEREQQAGLPAAIAAAEAAQEREDASHAALAAYRPATPDELYRWLAYIVDYERRLWGRGEVSPDRPNGLLAMAVESLLQNAPPLT